jgi:hypothetical protein
MDKYENDVHNCTNPQLADLLDEIANGAESGMKLIELDEEIIEIAKKENKILREAAKRLRIKQHELFNHEAFE